MNRQKDILKYLINNEQGVSIKELAKIFKVSDRTIYTDIKNINDKYFSLSTEIIIKSKYGVSIDQKVNKETIINFLKSNNDFELTPIERQVYIVREILLYGKKRSYEYLSLKLMVSKTSIFKDFKHIETVLNEKIFTVDNIGTEIIMNEPDVQKKTVKYINYLNDKFEIEFNKYCDLPEIVYNLLDKKIYKDIYYLLYNQNYDRELVSDHQIKSLAICLTVFIIRNNQGYYFRNNNNMKFKKKHEKSSLLRIVVNYIETSYNLIINEADIDYVYTQMLSHSFVEARSLEVESEYQHVIAKIISDIENELELSLTSDKDLYSKFVSHLYLMIYRVENKVYISNPFLNEIKSDQFAIFNLIFLIINRNLDFEVSESEVSFLVVYVHAIAEKKKLNRVILIVCPTGIGTSELIYNRIKPFIPSNDIVRVVSIKQLEDYKNQKCDLIVTPVELKMKEVPVVKISPIASKKDIVKIVDAYLELGFDNDKMSKECKVLSNYIDLEHIYLDSEFNSKEECIHKLSNVLIKEGVVKKEFENKILERERLGSTALSTGIAIPHADPKVVCETRIIFLNLQKSIKWGEVNCDIIFFICVSEKDLDKTRQIMVELHEILFDEFVMEELRKSHNKQKVIQVLRG